VGVIFKVNPANSGKIIGLICNKDEYPTNIYLYVDAGTNCTVQPNKDLEFNTWVKSPLTNRNSSILLDSSGNLTVTGVASLLLILNRFHLRSHQNIGLIITVIVTTIIGWSIPSIFRWAKARTQHKHFKECINQIGKLDKNAIEDKIKAYYVDSKLRAL
jgi:hypothetical protein